MLIDDSRIRMLSLFRKRKIMWHSRVQVSDCCVSDKQNIVHVVAYICMLTSNQKYLKLRNKHLQVSLDPDRPAVVRETPCLSRWIWIWIWTHPWHFRKHVRQIHNNYSMSPSWIWSDKITNERVARVGYNHFISNKGEWNNCFSKLKTKNYLKT